MHVVTLNAVRDALLTFERIEPGRKYDNAVDYKIHNILFPGLSLYGCFLHQIRVMLDRLTSPPKTTPDDVLAILLVLTNAYTQEISYEHFALTVERLARQLGYPDKGRLDRIVKTHLGDLRIRVNCLPRFTAEDTLAALDAYNEENFESHEGYACTHDIADALSTRLGFRVPHPLWWNELRNVIDIHLLQKRHLVDKIGYDWGPLVMRYEYCTLACLKRHGSID